jgi:hypothetical protein
MSSEKKRMPEADIEARVIYAVVIWGLDKLKKMAEAGDEEAQAALDHIRRKNRKGEI